MKIFGSMAKDLIIIFEARYLNLYLSGGVPASEKTTLEGVEFLSPKLSLMDFNWIFSSLDKRD